MSLLDKHFPTTNEDLMRVMSCIEAKLDELLAKKKPVKPRASKLEVDCDFEESWEIYPKRSGSNPKNKAYSAWKARLQGDNWAWDKMYEGVKRYLLFCDATGKTGTEYVMQAATFFGPDQHYENDWIIPKPKNNKPDIFDQSHKTVDFNAPVEVAPGVDPWADMK